MKDTMLVSIVKYQPKDDEREYYARLYTSTVANWAKDGLSKEAILFLCTLSCQLRDGLIWRIYQKDFVLLSETSGMIEYDIKKAIQELISKGYARKVSDDLYLIRNDRRVDY